MAKSLAEQGSLQNFLHFLWLLLNHMTQSSWIFPLLNLEYSLANITEGIQNCLFSKPSVENLARMQKCAGLSGVILEAMFSAMLRKKHHQQTYMSTASLGFSARMNSASASANLPSSSRYMACFRWISGSLFFIAIRANSNAKSNALKNIINLGIIQKGLTGINIFFLERIHFTLNAYKPNFPTRSKWRLPKYTTIQIYLSRLPV